MEITHRSKREGVEMKSHKGILSLHKEIDKGKYNKFIPSGISPDITKEYWIRPDGWRRKFKEVK